MNEILLQFKRFLVVGAGSSGKGAAKLLSTIGKKVRVTSDNTLSIGDRSLLESFGVEWEESGHTDAFIKWAEACVLSPGIKPDAVIVQKLIRANVKIVSEVDIASALSEKPWIAVTGSNGKTSTSTLLAACLSEILKPQLCGNIGKSFAEAVAESPDSPKVVELSSFQLKYSSHITPFISIILNLSPNHLNWHIDLDDYYDSKLSLIERTNIDGFILLNYDDAELRRRALRKTDLRIIWFSSQSPDADYFLINQKLYRKKNDSDQATDTRVSFSGIALQMPITNYVASAVCCLEMGVSPDHLNRTNDAFKSLKHRIQTVAVNNGVRFVNDSKSTTEASTIQALESCGDRIILLAGGVLKVDEFKVLAGLIQKHVISLNVYGSAAEKLHLIFHKIVNTTVSQTLDEAFEKACMTAKSGDTILLSPMCASFDQFKSFEERGDSFAELVKGRTRVPSSK